MQKMFITFFLLLSITASFAQSLSIQETSSPIYVDPFEYESEFSVKVHNETSQTRYIKVERIENNLAAGHESAICWDVCYDPHINQAIQPLELRPNHFIDSFILYLRPNNQFGYSEVRVRFYDRDNPADAVEHTFQLSVGGVLSVEDDLAGVSLSLPYPNPSDESAFLDYELAPSHQALSIEVKNLVGQIVHRQGVSGHSGQIALPMSEFPAGMYLLQLKAGERVLAKRKLMK